MRGFRGMFIVESIAKIRKMYHVDGKKIKAIARELKVSKNTVKKVIRSNATNFELSKYEKGKPVIGNYLPVLDKLLEENLKEPVRRRMTAKKLFEQLQQSGYSGSYESVNLRVREFRRTREARGKQVFIPLSFDSGDAFQFDWGTEEIELAGVITRVKAARIKLCYSRYSLVVVYPNEQLEMVMAAHDEAFKFFGGCCKRGLFDNMTTAIKKVLRGRDRILNEKFAQMASHYLFTVVACTPASGWEKGRVEKQVGDTRRNFFTPILKGKTYEEINAKLREMCINNAKTSMHPEFKDRTVFEVYEEELPSLIPYRGSFTAYRLHPTVVMPSSQVMYDTNRYSVDCAYVGCAVQIKSLAWHIEVLHESKLIGSHERCFGRYQSIYNPWHYVPALARKPGALRNGAPFKDLMSLLPSEFIKLRNLLESHKDCDKQFITVLQLIMKYGLPQVTVACSKAIFSGSCSSKLVEFYLTPNPPVATDEYIQLKTPPQADCEHYSQIYLSSMGGNA